MDASFLKIDYSLRPAKHTERRMLCDMFRRLTEFFPLSQYTYVGFGAIAFTDFILFHKALGVPNMISMERVESAKARMEANKPFNSIKIENKPSSKVLPQLAWSKPHIVWLDYDDQLSSEMFLDVGTVANHATSGTALALSFNCVKALETMEKEVPEGEPEPPQEISPFERFKNTFTETRIPVGTDELDLYGWKFGKLGRTMLLSEIKEVLAIRNLTLAEDEQIKFHEICSIEYSDSAKMTTLVGVFVSKKDATALTGCDFDGLDFLSKPKKPIRIDVPKLTLKEIKELERQLPLAAGVKLSCNSIPVKQANAFAKLYRYLPNFSVLEI